MKRNPFNAIFLVVICSTLLVFAEEVQNFDDDDGVTIESEKLDNPKPAYEALESTINYESPYIQPGKYHFAEHFDDAEAFEAKWIKSAAKKNLEDAESKYDGTWSIEPPQKQILTNDLGLVLKDKARHSAISSRLVKPFVFSDKPLVVQYEVQLQEGQECGGAYIKLLSSGKETTDLKDFHDKTPYTIMFGPDKCGNDLKLHFIFRHVNPLNGTIEEKHCRQPKGLEQKFADKKPHLYQLIIKPDNSYTINVDQVVVSEGSLLTDFTPAVNPPKEINDPKDFKPESWDEREKIPDPSSSKPDDWDEEEPPTIPDITAIKPDGWLDEEEMIPDPTAKKPADWDMEIDGDWEAPLIANPICEKAVGCGLWKAPMVSNPKYRGKWRAPLIDNPNYQGKWAPRRILNPDFFEDLMPFKMTPISAVGIELWSMSNNILFDNFLITDDVDVAEEWAAVTYGLKRKQIDLEAEVSKEPIKPRTLENKPFWWTVYIIWCMIPVSIYVWYLWKRANEETIVQRIMRITDDRPWLWAVFVLAFGLPLTIFIYFRCIAPKDEPSEADEPKKTDTVQPDDDQQDEIEEEEVEEEVVEVGEQERTRPASKLDLDQPLSHTPTPKENGENGDNDGEEDASSATESVPKEGARKRRARKE